MPKTRFQIGLTAIGAAAAAFVVLRGLLRKQKKLLGKVVVITGASSGIGEGKMAVHQVFWCLEIHIIGVMRNSNAGQWSMSLEKQQFYGH